MNTKTPIKQIGPWQRLTSEKQYDNPWITVYHESVITPGNTQGIYGRVHFKNSAVAIVALDADNHIYLVQQYRYTLDANAIELPMGGCPHDENPLMAGKRELLEETGLTAQRWCPLQTVHTSNSVTDEVGYAYLATGLSQGESQPEASEDITVLRIPFDEAVAWVLSGKITDAISISAILYVHCQQLANKQGS